jgi:hypothetical protein
VICSSTFARRQVEFARSAQQQHDNANICAMSWPAVSRPARSTEQHKIHVQENHTVPNIDICISFAMVCCCEEEMTMEQMKRHCAHNIVVVRLIRLQQLPITSLRQDFPNNNGNNIRKDVIVWFALVRCVRTSLRQRKTHGCYLEVDYQYDMWIGSTNSTLRVYLS